MELSNISVNNGVPKKRKLHRPSKEIETGEQRFDLCYKSAQPDIKQEYSLQPNSSLLQLPAATRQSIIKYLFRGVRITLANARTLDNEIYHPEETGDLTKPLTDHRPNILRVTAVCKQLRVEAWRLLRLGKFKAHRLVDIVNAEDATPLLARIEHLSIDLDSTWAFYDNYAQPRFPSPRSISTRYVDNSLYTDLTNIINPGFEYDHVMHRVQSAFSTGIGIDFSSFVGNEDVQWATYVNSVDVYARIELLSWKRTDFTGMIINGLLKIEEVGSGTASMWVLRLARRPRSHKRSRQGSTG